MDGKKDRKIDPEIGAQPEGDKSGCWRSSKEELVPQQPLHSPLGCIAVDGPEFNQFVADATLPRSRITIPVGMSTAVIDRDGRPKRLADLGTPNHGPRLMSETALLLTGVRACLHGDAMTAAWSAILLSLRHAGKRIWPASNPIIDKDRRPDVHFDYELIIEIELADGSIYPLEPCEVPSSCISPADGTSHALAAILIPNRIAFLDAMRRNALFGGTEWTEEGEQMLTGLLDRIDKNPPTKRFIEGGLLECEILGLIRREATSRLMVSASHGMQAPLGLIGSTSMMISRMRFPDERPERVQSPGGTASGLRKTKARNQMSAPQRREIDLKTANAAAHFMTEKWMEEQDAKREEREMRKTERHRADLAERRYAALVLAIEKSGNELDVSEDGLPVINPNLEQTVRRASQ